MAQELAAVDGRAAEAFAAVFGAGGQHSTLGLAEHARDDVAGAAARLRGARRAWRLALALRSSHSGQRVIWQATLSVVAEALRGVEKAVDSAGKKPALQAEVAASEGWALHVRAVAAMLRVGQLVMRSAEDALFEDASLESVAAEVRGSAAGAEASLRAMGCAGLADTLAKAWDAEGSGEGSELSARICALTWQPICDAAVVSFGRAECLPACGNLFVNRVLGTHGITTLLPEPAV